MLVYHHERKCRRWSVCDCRLKITEEKNKARKYILLARILKSKMTMIGLRTVLVEFIQFWSVYLRKFPVLSHSEFQSLLFTRACAASFLRQGHFRLESREATKIFRETFLPLAVPSGLAYALRCVEEKKGNIGLYVHRNH